MLQKESNNKNKKDDNEEHKLDNLINKLDEFKSKIPKTDGMELAPGIRLINSKKGVIGIAADLTAKDEISLANGQLVIPKYTSLGIFVDDKKILSIESSNDINVYKGIIKVGSFSQLKVDSNGNIVDSNIKGKLIIPNSLVFNGIQEAIYKALNEN